MDKPRGALQRGRAWPRRPPRARVGNGARKETLIVLSISKTNSKASETDRAERLIAGLQKHFANVTSLKFASADHTPDEIAKALQALVALHTAVESEKPVLKAKLDAVKVQAPPLRKQMRAFRSFVLSTFSESADVLADFGLEPKKAPTPLTTAQRAVALAKREATRKARGTTGSKAKKAVTGDVVDVVTTPVKAVPQVVTTSVAPSTAGNGGATGGTTTHGA